ncbi:Uncharacterised protein [Escherichia coli]|uniref:Uncharacterized protein n=1 Tax=Escherichia coli TaxID=562 RepID=A0A377DG71_ECOLX|nr:Uncharacterised protein [Escherichia coli]
MRVVTSCTDFLPLPVGEGRGEGIRPHVAPTPLQRLADVLQHIVRRRHHFGVHLVSALHRNHRHHFVDDIHVRAFQRIVLQGAKPILARYAFGRLTAGSGFQIEVVAFSGKPRRVGEVHQRQLP